MTDKIPGNAALRSRVADLLHLLQFARIETPTAGDAEQAEKAMNDLERMLAAPAAPAAPVAAVPDGWKLVPVERIQIALEAVQNAMLDAYSNAYQECCGRGQGQCCGDPDAAWGAEDQRIMDALAPAQRELSALLAAAPAAPVAVQPLPYWAPCNPACDPELNGSRSKLCDCAQATAALAAPPAAEQPDTVAAPRELLAEAESIIDSYAEALRASHAPGGDWDDEEGAQDDYEREAGVALKLRRLLAGGAE